jgi:hypothetical protein
VFQVSKNAKNLNCLQTECFKEMRMVLLNGRRKKNPSIDGKYLNEHYE